MRGVREDAAAESVIGDVGRAGEAMTDTSDESSSHGAATKRERVAATRQARRFVGDSATGDDDLVGRALRGERWAEEVLYRRHVERVLRVSDRILLSPSDAEEVTQDAFAKGFDRLSTLREPARFGGWVCRMAVNEARQRLRRRSIRRRLGMVDDAGDPAILAELVGEAASQEERLDVARLDAALRRLGASERACWVLRHVEGHSLQEVAELTGHSLATVKRRLTAAAALIATVAADGGAP